MDERIRQAAEIVVADLLRQASLECQAYIAGGLNHRALESTLKSLGNLAHRYDLGAMDKWWEQCFWAGLEIIEEHGDGQWARRLRERERAFEFMQDMQQANCEHLNACEVCTADNDKEDSE